MTAFHYKKGSSKSWLSLHQIHLRASCLFLFPCHRLCCSRLAVMHDANSEPLSVLHCSWSYDLTNARSLLLAWCAVVFGRVEAGMPVVRKIEACGSSSGRTRQPVVIADCGEMPTRRQVRQQEQSPKPLFRTPECRASCTLSGKYI